MNDRADYSEFPYKTFIYSYASIDVLLYLVIDLCLYVGVDLLFQRRLIPTSYLDCV